jgi:hypothetical protein
MSSQNAFPGPNAGRPAARPTNPERSRQPSWVNPQAQTGHAQQPASTWPPQQEQGFQGGFPQQQGYGGRGSQQAPQQPGYEQWGELQPDQYGQPGPVQADPYAPQFEPYVAPGSAPYGRQPAPGFAQQPAGQAQWPGRGADSRGFDAGAYGAPAYAPQSMPQHGGTAFGEHAYSEPELSSADWAGQPSDFRHDSYQQGDDLGFAQADGGELDAAYGEDDGEYEDEEAPRSRRPMMIMAALIGAIVVGGGMAYGYKHLGSSERQGDPPVIKSEAFPAKTKPADAGGKMFPYSDTKIMGRLGDGTSSAAAAPSTGAAPSPDTTSSDNTSQTASADPSTDDGGPRKVSTLVVGRDGSIQAPPEAPASAPEPSSQAASVPGTSLDDVFGQHKDRSAAAPTRDEPLPEPRRSRSVSGDDTPAPMKKAVTPVRIAKVNSVSGSKPSSTGSIEERDDAAAPSRKHLKKVARAEPTTTSDADAESGPPVIPSRSGGFVAVLASIPHSSSSRMDALKRFADMQQKYSTALAGKTPDVAAANLGSKGNYDRLIVGPPGSRAHASDVCIQLKSQGYTNCWVTTY